MNFFEKIFQKTDSRQNAKINQKKKNIQTVFFLFRLCLKFVEDDAAHFSSRISEQSFENLSNICIMLSVVDFLKSPMIDQLLILISDF